MVMLLAIAFWVLLVAVVYWATVAYVLVDLVAPWWGHICAAFIAGACLAPGLLIGHGMLPVPAGYIIYLALDPSERMASSYVLFHAASWLVTAIFLLAISTWRRKRAELRNA